VYIVQHFLVYESVVPNGRTEICSFSNQVYLKEVQLLTVLYLQLVAYDAVSGSQEGESMSLLPKRNSKMSDASE
jgi:hypothetical protein